MKPIVVLLVGLLAGAGSVVVWQLTRPATVNTAELRPPRVPIVAVGSRIHWNIPYIDGASEQQTLDVYSPADSQGAPVVVYVHRGEWARGDKSEVSYKPKLLNENGIVFVSVNYRLSDVAPHPAQADDVAAALRWVHDHIADYGGSAARIVLMGHSAGCHIASLVGLDPRPLAKFGLAPDVLRGVVCWSGGAYDLAEKVAQGGMYKPYIEKNFGTNRADLDDASPVHHVKEVVPGARFLFVSAGEGKPASRDLSERMAREIQAAGGIARAVTFEGKTHFTTDYECGLPEDPLNTGNVLLEFVESSTSRDSSQ
jgi:acetyl esterase/lipase